MYNQKYDFEKTGREMDKELFASLLNAAKGNRTMKSFADACGVQPSTFSRIIRKQNIGPSSPLLLERIAENADKDSNVSIGDLAYANGYVVELRDADTSLKHQYDIIRKQACGIITDELLSRNSSVELKKPYIKSSLPYTCRFSFLIETESSSCEKALLGIDVMPLTDSFINVDVLQKLYSYALAAVNSEEKYPIRFVFLVFEPNHFSELKAYYKEMILPADVSILLLDLVNDKFIDEFSFINEKGIRPKPLFD